MLIAAGYGAVVLFSIGILWGRAQGRVEERRAWVAAIFTARADEADDAKVGCAVTTLTARVARCDGWN